MPSAGSYVGFAFHGGNAVRPGLGRHAAAFIFYLVISLLLPVYVWRRDRGSFSIVSHVLPAIVAVGVIAYGLYEFVLPSQPPPANRFWIYIAAITVLALAGSLVIVRRLGGTIDALGGVAPAEEQDRVATAAADPAMSSFSPPAQPAEAAGEPA